MDCNCIKQFSFVVDISECDKITFIDTTTWVDAPSSYTLSVIPPGTSESYDVEITPSQSTVFTSETFGWSEGLDLPEGIWCISTTACGNLFESRFLNLCKLYCAVYNRISCGAENALELYMMLKGAEAKFKCEACSGCSQKAVIDIITNVKENLDDCSC